MDHDDTCCQNRIHLSPNLKTGEGCRRRVAPVGWLATTAVQREPLGVPMDQFFINAKKNGGGLLVLSIPQEDLVTGGWRVQGAITQAVLQFQDSVGVVAGVSGGLRNISQDVCFMAGLVSSRLVSGDSNTTTHRNDSYRTLDGILAVGR